MGRPRASFRAQVLAAALALVMLAAIPASALYLRHIEPVASIADPIEVDAPLVAGSWVHDRNGDKIDDRFPGLPGFRSVIVGFDAPLHSAQRHALQSIDGVQILMEWRIVPAAWAFVHESALSAMAELEFVERIEWDQRMEPMLDTSAAAIEASDSRSDLLYKGAWRGTTSREGEQGQGALVALLDGGIDDMHPALDDMDDDPNTNDPKVQVKMDAWTYALARWALQDQTETQPVNASFPYVVDGRIDDPTGMNLTGDFDFSNVHVPRSMPHATALASVIAGTGEASSTMGVDSHEFIGIAPRARLADVNIFIGFDHPCNVEAVCDAVGPIVGWRPGGSTGVPTYALTAPCGAVPCDDEEGPTIASLITGMEMILAYNEENPDDPIEIAVLPVLDTTTCGVENGGTMLEVAVDTLAATNNVTIIISAGQNNGEDGICLPANVPRALTVGAFDHRGTPSRLDDERWASSDRPNATQEALAKPEVYAPGVGITTARSDPPDYYTVTGSSVAAAHAAGAAAILLSASQHELRGMALKAALIRSADGSHDPFASPGQFVDNEPDDPAPDGVNDNGAREGWSVNWGYGALRIRDAVCGLTDCPMDWEALDTALLRDPANPWPLVSRVREEVEFMGRIAISDSRASGFWHDRDEGLFYQDGGPAGAGVKVHFAFTSNLVPAGQAIDPSTFTSVAQTTTQPDGSFVLEFTIPDNTPPGPRFCVLYTEALQETAVRDGLRPASPVPCILNVMSRTQLDIDLCQDDDNCNPSHPVISFQDVPDVDLLRGKVKLIDGADKPVERAAVNIKWGGASPGFQDRTLQTSEEFGEILLKIPVSGQAGTFPLVVTFTPTTGSFLEPAQIAVPVTVALGTKVDVKFSNVPAGSTFIGDGSSIPLAIEGRITTLAGMPVADADLKIEVTSVTGRVTPMDPPLRSDQDGRFSGTFEARNLQGGIFEVSVRYDGLAMPGTQDAYILIPTTSFRLPFTVILQPLLNLHENQVLYRGEESVLTGTLRTPFGRPLSNETVEVELLGRGAMLGSVQTDNQGRLEFRVTSGFDESLGDLALRARFRGDEGLAPAAAVQLVEMRGRSHLTMFSGQTAQGGEAVLQGFLFDDTGRPVVGEKVNLMWGADQVGHATTSSLGRYQYVHQVESDQRVGPVTVRAGFGGLEYLDASQAQNTFGVITGTTLDVTEAGRSVNGVVNFQTRILDDRGTPLTEAEELQLYLSEPRPADEQLLSLLTSLDLSNALAPELMLRHAYDFEDNVGINDGSRVVVSLDGGTTWQPIEPRNGYPQQKVAAFADQPAWSGQTAGWFPREADLSDYVGESDVRIRWRTATSPLANDIAVRLDDVHVFDGNKSLFRDGFEQFGTQDDTNHWRLNSTPAFVVGREEITGTRAHVLATNLDGTYPASASMVAQSPRFQVPAGGMQVLFRYQLDLGEGDVAHFMVEDISTEARTLLHPYRQAGATTLPESDQWRWLMYEVPSDLLGRTVRFHFDFQSDAIDEGTGLLIDEFRVLEAPTVEYALRDEAGAPGDFLHWRFEGFQGGPIYDVDTYERHSDNAPRYATIENPDTQRSFVDGPLLVNPPFPIAVLKSSADALTVYPQGLVALGDTRDHDPNAPCLAFKADNPGQGCTLGDADWELGVPVVAPAWDAGLNASQAEMLVRTTGQAPNREFVIEWRNLQAEGAQQASGSRFQVRFHEAGDIEFQYGSLIFGDQQRLHDLGARATVGLRDPFTDRNFKAHQHEAVLAETVRITFSRIHADLSGSCDRALCFGILPKQGGGYAPGQSSAAVYDTGFDLSETTDAYLVVRQFTQLGRGDALAVHARSVSETGWRPVPAIQGGSSVSSGAFHADHAGTFDTVVYDLSAFSGARTQVRFQINADNAGQDVGVVLQEVFAVVGPQQIDGQQVDDFSSYLDTTRGGPQWWSSQRLGASSTAPPWAWAEHEDAVPDALGARYLRLGGKGPLPDSSEFLLVSPPIDLAGTKDPALSFWIDFDVKDELDATVVEISTDGGATYRPLAMSDGSYRNHAPTLGGPGWVGKQFGFAVDTFDLTPYAAQDVRLRLEFAAQGNPFGARWLLDELRVTDRMTGVDLLEEDGSFDDDLWNRRPEAWAHHPLAHALEHDRPGLEPSVLLPASGAATQHNVALPSSTPLGYLHAAVVFPGIPNTFAGTMHISELLVQRETQVSDVRIDNMRNRENYVVRGDSFQVDGLVRGQDGAAIRDGLVQVAFDDIVVASARTDEAGRFQTAGIFLPDATSLGRHRLTVEYTGEPSEFILGSQRSMNIAVKGQSQLEVVRQVAEGDQFRVTLKLSDDQGNPLPDTAILVRIPGQDVQQVVTDGLGEVTVSAPVSIDDATQVEYVAVSPGTEFLLGSNVEGNSLVPPAPAGGFPWWLVVLAAVLLFAAAAAFVLLRRRRHRVHLAEDLQEEIARIQYRLETGDPVRQSIYELYRAFRTAITRAGLGRPDSETPAEVSRILRDVLPGPSHGDVDALTSLFEEARYSEHQLGDADRGRARAGLERLRASLQPPEEVAQ